MKDIINELFEDFYALSFSYEGMELYSYKSLGIVVFMYVHLKQSPFPA